MFYRWKRRSKRYLLFMLSACMLGFCLPAGNQKVLAAEAKEEKSVKGLADITKSSITYRIVLDPGHGGNDTGADGWNSSEKRLNLLIGTYLKEELEKYSNVKVIMTRKKDVYVGLHKRMEIAKKKKVDLVISLHNDSWDAGTPYDNGSSVLVARKGSYRPELAVQEIRLARSILSELEGLGLVNRGLIRKKSARVLRYEDGSAGDYHAIIRDGMRYGIPSILIEHAFCDNRGDYNKFLKTEKQLRALAAADARGIARYLQLQRKDTGESLPPIEINEKKQLCTANASAYYTLAKKRYYNKLYAKMMSAGKLRHESNLNLAEEGAQKEKKGQMEAELIEKKMKAEAVAMAKKNAASEKKAPYVICAALGIFAVVILFREFEFGFHVSVRIKKRNDKYDKWKDWRIDHNMEDRRRLKLEAVTDSEN